MSGLVSGRSFLISTLAAGPVSCFFHSDQSLTIHGPEGLAAVAAGGLAAGGGSPQLVRAGMRRAGRRAERNFMEGVWGSFVVTGGSASTGLREAGQWPTEKGSGLEGNLSMGMGWPK